MIRGRTRQIKAIVAKLSGKNGEPANARERYILNSMWVMMLAEFEGSIKALVETHIDKVKKLPIEKIHTCLLMQHFFPDKDGKISLENIISVHTEDPQNINYAHFTRDKKPKYKSDKVQRLFNSIGVFFSPAEITQLRTIDAIASTRDSIAHGDVGVQITHKELLARLNDLYGIYDLLKRKT